MIDDKVRKLIELSPKQNENLLELARLCGALSSTGSRIGEPSIYVLVKRIGDLDVELLSDGINQTSQLVNQNEEEEINSRKVSRRLKRARVSKEDFRPKITKKQRKEKKAG